MKFKTLSLIVIIALLVFSCKGVKKTVAISTDDIPAEEPPQTEVLVQEVQEEAPPQVDIRVRSESVKPIADQNDKTLYAFYVIIGSFNNVDNARRFNAELIGKGFSPSILENENSRFRISVGGYNEENAARAKIAEIRTNYKEHKDVWLLIRK